MLSVSGHMLKSASDQINHMRMAVVFLIKLQMQISKAHLLKQFYFLTIKNTGMLLYNVSFWERACGRGCLPFYFSNCAQGRA